MPPRTPRGHAPRDTATSHATPTRRRQAQTAIRRAASARIKTRSTPVATMSDRPPTTGAPAADEATTGNLDKVRDILFGGQIRDFDRKFARLEERLGKETAELKEDVRKRLAAVEQFIKTESEALADRLRGEHDERAEAIKDLSRELRETSKTFEKKTGLIDDQLARAQRELRQQLLDLQQRLTDDLAQKIDGVLDRLSAEARELRTDKADRSTLAALLTEMALRLTNETPASDAAE